MPSYPITPVPKPRMTRRDARGDKRPAVARYHAFKDECRLRKVSMPLAGAHVRFYLPMPKSWPKKKRALMSGQPHHQTPDVDNMLKALLDAVHIDDKAVWDVRVTKYWAVEGKIVISTGDA